MKHTEYKFQGCGDRSIYYQYWQPASGVPKALLLVAHGAGEHGGRYREFAQYFVEHSYAVAVLDHNGHGHSDGTPGHVEHFDDYLVDFRAFHREMVARFPATPVILIGHSLGGLIGSNYLLQYQREFVGCVLSGSSIKSELEPGVVQTWLIRLMAILTPKLGVLQLDANSISRDPEEVRKYVEDPQIHHGKLSARTLREMFAGMTAVTTRAGEISLPLLIIHGGADTITSPQGSRMLHEHCSSTDKTLKIYPGLFHEIFNEPERAQVWQDVVNWCDAHLPTV